MYFLVLATSVEQDREVKDPTERVGFPRWPLTQKRFKEPEGWVTARFGF